MAKRADVRGATLMGKPLAVVLDPATREHEEHARVAAQVLVEAAFRVRTSWPSRREGKGAQRVRCVVSFEPDDVRLGWSAVSGESPALLLLWDRRDGEQVPTSVAAEVRLSRVRLDLARVASWWLANDVGRRLTDVFSSHPMMTEHPWIRHVTLVAVREKKYGVHSLAVDVGCSERHLEKQWADMWRESVGHGRPLPRTLKKFLDTILLLEAFRGWLAEPSPHARWSRIAPSLGVTQRTVRNVMCDVLETTPSDVAVSNIVPLIMRLESELLSPFERGEAST